MREGHLRLVLLAVALIVPISSPAQTTSSPAPPQSPTAITQSSQTSSDDSRSGVVAQKRDNATQFLDSAGQSIEHLVEAGLARRGDLLAARERLVIAEGRLRQAGLRPNPELEAEYGSARLLGGEAESDFEVGVSQRFESGGKRGKRVAVARLELLRARAELLTLERRFATELRAAYARAVAGSRQLGVLKQSIEINEELVRVTNERLKEGDVAPIELKLVQVETDRLHAAMVRVRGELESEIISLRALAGFETSEDFRVAPPADRPPRLDMSLAELTEIALRERHDLQAARIGEELGTARINLAEAQSVPDVSASVSYSRERSVIDAGSFGELRDRDNSLAFGVRIEIPVFNRNQGEIIAATGERAEATRQREFLEATIRRDVAFTFRRYRAAAEAFVLYATQIVPRSAEIVESVRAAYGLGEFSIFDVLNEQRRLIESEIGRTEALRDYYAALAELEAAIGIQLPASGFAPDQTSVLPDSVPRFDAQSVRAQEMLKSSNATSFATAQSDTSNSPAKQSSSIAIEKVRKTDSLEGKQKGEPQ